MSSQHILLLTPGRPVLYTTTRALFPVLLPTSPTAGDVCKELKKTGQFVSDLQICCHFTTQNSKTDIKTNGETNTFPICLSVLSEQLVFSQLPKVIPLCLRIGACLRRLATGEPYSSLETSFQISKTVLVDFCHKFLTWFLQNYYTMYVGGFQAAWLHGSL
jgi:hypothetical protein